MFTGIIEAVGELEAFDDASSILWVQCALFQKRPPKPGSSIAVDGVCLTASHMGKLNDGVIGFDLGEETRLVTLLCKKQTQDRFNIEYALCAGDPLDGHLVQGHVDAISTVLGIEEGAQGLLITFSLPANLATLIVTKGSIAINGVSLTVNQVTNASFTICLVPYTVAHTNFTHLGVGHSVHLETDVVGRYLNRFFETHYHAQVAQRNSPV